MDADLPDVVLTLIIVFVVLFIGVFAVNGVAESGDIGDGGSETAQQTALLDGTNWVTLGDGTGTNETVYNSRGYAVALTGASDSYIQSEEDIDISTYNDWTVSFWASRDEATSETMTAISVDGEVQIAYDGSSNQWTGWYYDSGATASYRVNVSASSSPGQLENIVLDRSASTLAIYANTTQGESVSTDGSNTAPHPTGTNWDGRLEEIRVADETWGGTERQNHYTDPIDPIQTGQNARIMFDEPDRSTQRLFWHAGDIATSNASFEAGLPGEEMVSGDVLLQQSDYGWKTAGPQIRAISGGELEHAPAAYVDYTKSSGGNPLVKDFTSAIGLAGILFLLLPLLTILGYLISVRDAR